MNQNVVHSAAGHYCMSILFHILRPENNGEDIADVIFKFLNLVWKYLIFG